MEEQKNITNMGGTMRLGGYECMLREGSRAREIYQKEEIRERHRHRYEFNNLYREEFENAGMKCTGINPESDLVEIVEIPENKFFVACQYHPELSSRPNRPEELYTAFVTVAVENSN